MESYIRISQAAKHINRTPLSVKHWYKWVDQIGEDVLPVRLPKILRVGKRGDMYIKEADLPLLEQFRDYIAINRGIMGDYNTSRRGEIGVLEAERREFKKYLKTT